MTSNLRIWDKVRTVDPAHTKPIVGKPYKGTTVKFQALCAMATELWGPCGLGWGWTEPQHLIVPLAEGEILHVATLTLWYVEDGKRCDGVPHVGQTYLVRKGKNGLMSDEDAPKKSVTDALTKALSCVGFAADIYMGLWDDNAYVDQVRREKEQERKAEAERPIDDAQRTHLMTLIEQTNTDVRAFCDHFQIDSLKDLPSASFGQATTLLNRKLKKAA